MFARHREAIEKAKNPPLPSGFWRGKGTGLKLSVRSIRNGVVTLQYEEGNLCGEKTTVTLDKLNDFFHKD